MTRQVTELVSCKAAWLHVLGVHQVTRILNDIVKDTDRVAGVVSSKGRRLPARRSLRRRGVALRDLARREMLSATRFTSRSLSRDGEVDAGMIPTRDGRVTGRRPAWWFSSTRRSRISRSGRDCRPMCILLRRVRQRTTHTYDAATFVCELHSSIVFVCFVHLLICVALIYLYVLQIYLTLGTDVPVSVFAHVSPHYCHYNSSAICILDKSPYS